MPLVVHPALRILAAVRRGSSLPLLVETAGGEFLVKLRGAAQGVAPLIAEILVAELATTLGLPVPERVLVTLDEAVPSDDRNDELADLIRRSYGMNLGFRYLRGATDIALRDVSSIDPQIAASILWLDGLIMNPDRTPRNPNILIWNRQPWLIDHGAALSFHYDWAALREETPRERRFEPEHHLFAARAGELSSVDDELARRLDRAALEHSVGMIPRDFVSAAFPSEDVERIPLSYAAFLWKRLRAPRPFV